MIVMFITWMFLRGARDRRQQAETADASTEPNLDGRKSPPLTLKKQYWYHDLVDRDSVDLYRDEHEEEPSEQNDLANKRLTGSNGPTRWLWSLYYWLV